MLKRLVLDIQRALVDKNVLSAILLPLPLSLSRGQRPHHASDDEYRRRSLVDDEEDERPVDPEAPRVRVARAVGRRAAARSRRARLGSVARRPAALLAELHLDVVEDARQVQQARAVHVGQVGEPGQEHAADADPLERLAQRQARLVAEARQEDVDGGGGGGVERRLERLPRQARLQPRQPVHLARQQHAELRVSVGERQLDYVAVELGARADAHVAALPHHVHAQRLLDARRELGGGGGAAAERVEPLDAQVERAEEEQLGAAVDDARRHHVAQPVQRLQLRPLVDVPARQIGPLREIDVAERRQLVTDARLRVLRCDAVSVGRRQVDDGVEDAALRRRRLGDVPVDGGVGGEPVFAVRLVQVQAAVELLAGRALRAQTHQAQPDADVQRAEDEVGARAPAVARELLVKLDGEAIARARHALHVRARGACRLQTVDARTAAVVGGRVQRWGLLRQRRAHRPATDASTISFAFVQPTTVLLLHFCIAGLPRWRHLPSHWESAGKTLRNWFLFIYLFYEDIFIQRGTFKINNYVF